MNYGGIMGSPYHLTLFSPSSRLTYTAQVLTHGRVVRRRTRRPALGRSVARQCGDAPRYGHAVKYISTSYFYV